MNFVRRPPPCCGVPRAWGATGSLRRSISGTHKVSSYWGSRCFFSHTGNFQVCTQVSESLLVQPISTVYQAWVTSTDDRSFLGLGPARSETHSYIFPMAPCSPLRSSVGGGPLGLGKMRKSVFLRLWTFAPFIFPENPCRTQREVVTLTQLSHLSLDSPGPSRFLHAGKSEARGLG